MIKNKQGKLIVIEGVDGSGKSTQTRFLISRLKKEGKTVKSIKYPRHSTPFFGLMVDDYLNNKFGTADKINPYLASLLYACDRWETKDHLNEWLEKGYWIVPDRYMTSNLGHQLGKIKSNSDKEKFLKWEDDLEFKTFGIPKPNLVIYLDIPIRIVNQLLSRKRSEKDKKYSSGGRDGHESNLDHLRNAQKGYEYCVNKYKNWIAIDCVKNGQLLSPDKIHERIWKKVIKIL